MPAPEKPADQWDRNYLLRSPLFAPLNHARQHFQTDCWPTLAEYNQFLGCLKHAPVNHDGMPVRCVAPAIKPLSAENEYEPALYLRGELQTRENNWHDFFNLLVWATFPKTKAALNQRHFLARSRHIGNASNRGKEQDAITLFDESGIVVACADPALGEMLRELKWKPLFWQHRREVVADMRFYVFGHALYEKALQPYPGMTGKVIIIPATSESLTRPLSSQIEYLDHALAVKIVTRTILNSSSETSPLPLLGVPGWTPANERESFYDNSRIFRPARNSRRSVKNFG